MNSNMLNKVRNQIGMIAVMAGLAVGFASTAQASILVTSTATNSADASFTPYTVSTTDLLNGATPIASSGDFTIGGSTGLPALTDGSFTIVGDGNAAAFASGGSGVGTSVTYSLGGDPRGYNLTSISVYGGWVGPNSFGRDGQGYHILYSTIDAPTTYNPLTAMSPAFQPSDTGDKVGTRVSFTNGPLLASGVANLRFDFDVTVLNGWSGYAEIDAFGDVVPEPSTVMLLGLGGLLVWKRVRRTQS